MQGLQISNIYSFLLPVKEFITGKTSIPNATMACDRPIKLVTNIQTFAFSAGEFKIQCIVVISGFLASLWMWILYNNIFLYFDLLSNVCV